MSKNLTDLFRRDLKEQIVSDSRHERGGAVPR